MYLFAHAVTERAIDELVLLHLRLAAKLVAHDHRLEVMTVSGHFHVMALQAVLDDGFDLFLTLLLYPSFVWDDPAYHLEKDSEQRSFAEILVDVIAADIIEPWGGGKWHLEVFRSTAAEPDDWNGEM